ncbi:MAG: hypothetical protein ACO31I_13950, partial [Prochlorotrichaceae cyanobacterium]
QLPRGKVILWCYLIWYLVNVSFYFDPSLSLWLNSLGLSFIIGLALTLSISKSPRSKSDPWQIFRLFLIPFCVSSFSSLIKNQGFILVIPPKSSEQLTAIGACLFFVAIVYTIKFAHRKD